MTQMIQLDLQLKFRLKTFAKLYRIHAYFYSIHEVKGAIT